MCVNGVAAALSYMIDVPEVPFAIPQNEQSNCGTP